jgi:ribosome biogenesis GTPase A
MDIHWYPGHMVKAKKDIENSLKLVDIVIELLDARIPRSSRNPDIDDMCRNKYRIIVLNKSDLSDKGTNAAWNKYFTDKGLICIEIDSLSGKGVRNIVKSMNSLFKDRDKKLKDKGIVSKPIRALVVGIPNVGKSSLINRLSGRTSAKTGNKPGVTMGRQWIKIGGSLELLDTPGILYPKFEDDEAGLNLAFTGAIKDEVINREELAVKLIKRLKEVSPESIRSRYKIKDIESEPLDILNQIGAKRGCIIRGGNVDIEKASNILIDEFRSGKLGAISLERP